MGEAVSTPSANPVEPLLAQAPSSAEPTAATATPSAPTSPESENKSAPPSWFRRSKLPPVSGAPEPIKVKPVEDPDRPWHVLLWLLITGMLGKGMSLSLVVHATMAAALSLVFYHQEIGLGGLTTLLVEQGQEAEQVGFDEAISIEPPGGLTGDIAETALTPTDISAAFGPNDPLGLPETPQLKGGGGDGDAQGAGIGDGLDVHGGFRMPGAGQVVRKGSFTAWTVPADPAPGENYLIIIQVQYKNSKQKLNPNDVSGMVIGTDGYRKRIMKSTVRFLPDASQVVIDIPGAEVNVRDTIRIYSTILRESQNLEIVF